MWRNTAATTTLLTRIAFPKSARQKILRSPSFLTKSRSFASYAGDTNITYSGGQAINGQGGFYGSGGSRSTLDPTTSQKVGLVALATDVQTVQHTMRELETLENLLQREFENSPKNSAPTGKLIELKASIKKLMTSSEFTTALNKLEVEGEPVWGLSSEERELISFAREKFNEC